MYQKIYNLQEQNTLYTAYDVKHPTTTEMLVDKEEISDSELTNININ